VLQGKSDELIKQLESTENEYLWQIKLSEKAAEKIQTYRDEKEALTRQNQEQNKLIKTLKENNKNLEMIF